MNRSEQLMHIPIDQIRPNPHQPRREFSSDELKELAASIKSVGLIQPITVRSLKDGYELVVGERRLRAAALLGLKEIPALLVNMDDQESALIALIENLQRNDLNFYEEAAAIDRLMKEQQYTQRELAELLGKKQSTLSNKLRLLVLPQAILETLVRHQLTERHARALLRIEKTSDLKKTVRKIVANQLNVKETEALVAELGNLVPEEPVVVRKRIRGLVNYKIYLNTLKQSLETIRSSGGELTYTENYFDDEIEVVIRLKK